MNRLRYALLGVLVAALVALVVVTVTTDRQHASTAASLSRGTVLTASASVFPQSFLFGDAIHIRIDALVDRRQVDPNRLHLDARWTPYQPVVGITRVRTDVGPYTRLLWAFDLHCVIVECVPQSGSIARTTFQPTTISYSGRATNGKAVAPVTVTWPQLSAVSRLDPQDIERRAIVNRVGPTGQIRAILPPWRVSSTDLAAVSYRLSPSLVFWLALALALTLLLASALLLRPWLPLGWIPRRARPVSRIEWALAAVERARGGETDQERKALELLAEELRRSGRSGLAWTASELAWSSSAPEDEQTTALTRDVRRALAGRTNGRRP